MRPSVRALLAAAMCLALHTGVVAQMAGDELFTMQPSETRWQSFENPTAGKGQGGKANEGAKGRPYEILDPGETLTLLNLRGAGVVRRIWLTLDNASPAAQRNIRIDMYWDGYDTPAVSAPLGAFMGSPLGAMRPFENELFANPEGRSFNCYIPMPFRDAARITLTNESKQSGPENRHRLFYDVNVTLTPDAPEDMLYFHAHWRRERPTETGEAFTLLPRVQGRGRFLGAHIGVEALPGNIGWWGEGEVKVYLDGDREFPTLVGTGTEDYIGTAWGQGEFAHRYQGAWMVDNEAERYSFYRYHIPDPVWFEEDIRVTLQQMGGTGRLDVQRMLDIGMDVEPVSLIGPDGRQYNLLGGTDPSNMFDPLYGNWWTNYYRQDDVSAVSFFYLDAPNNALPALAGVDQRTAERYMLPLEEKPVVLCFLGAARELRTVAAPLLTEFQYNTTIFVSVDNIGEDAAGLLPAQVAQLQELGHEIGAAPSGAVQLTDAGAVANEVVRIGARLNAAFIPRPAVYAWPQGAPAPTGAVVSALRDAGIGFILIFTGEPDAPVLYEVLEEESMFVPALAGGGEFVGLRRAADASQPSAIPVIAVQTSIEAEQEGKPAFSTHALVELLKYLRDESFDVMALRELRRYRMP